MKKDSKQGYLITPNHPLEPMLHGM